MSYLRYIHPPKLTRYTILDKDKSPLINQVISPFDLPYPIINAEDYAYPTVCNLGRFMDSTITNLQEVSDFPK